MELAELLSSDLAEHFNMLA